MPALSYTVAEVSEVFFSCDIQLMWLHSPETFVHWASAAEMSSATKTSTFPL